MQPRIVSMKMNRPTQSPWTWSDSATRSEGNGVFRRRRLAWRAILCVTTIAIAVTGCASVPRDAGLATVQHDVSSRTTGQVEWREHVRTSDDPRVRTMLTAAPLDADKAVAIALINSPRVQVL